MIEGGRFKVAVKEAGAGRFAAVGNSYCEEKSMNQELRRFLLVLVGLPAIFASGCNIFFNPCANVTCDDGDVCVNGECVPEPACTNNDDCGAGEVCDNGECVDEPECLSDGDCDGGQVCDEATNTCVECEGNADCDDGDACTTDSCAGLLCLNVPVTCTSVANCPDGCDRVCANGFCNN